MFNKVVLITGAAGGIGIAVAKKFASEGANLALVDLSLDAVKKVIEDLNLDDTRALALQADVSKEEQVKAYVDATVNKFGCIDTFFNNAGVEGISANVEEYDTNTFNYVLDVNVKGVFLGLKYVIPVMKNQNSGSIVNTASIGGLIGSPGMVAYNASKLAVIGITRTVANEVMPLSIRINAVVPGVINTRMMRRIEENVAPVAANEAQKATAASVPLGRYGEPEEVANVVSFLLLDEASYVTQSVYTVDGGMYNQ